MNYIGDISHMICISLSTIQSLGIANIGVCALKKVSTFIVQGINNVDMAINQSIKLEHSPVIG